MIQVHLIIVLCLITRASLSLEGNKMCRYRNEPLFPKSLWNLRVGAGCYFYSPSDWFIKKAPLANVKLNITGVVHSIPVTKIGNKNVAFDYSNDEYSKLIASTFKTEALYKKWVSCARNGDECCNYMTDENIKPSKEYPCPAVWDAWTCFEPAPADSVSEKPCPEYTRSSNNTPCVLYSRKQCWENGTWNQHTDYSTCAAAPIQRRRHNFHVIVLYLSIVLCTPAIVIFISYRNLRILRVVLHRNLLIACVVRSIFAVIQKEVVILDSLKPSGESNNVLNENGVACRILAVLTSVSANAIYACMLLDGYYLHKIIVRIFSPDPNIYVMYGIGAGLSILPTAVWAILLATLSDKYCWTVNNSWYQWIPDGFRIAILALNLLLLIDIFRGLLTKLRQNVNVQHTKYTYFLVDGTFHTRNYVLEMAYISTLKAMSFLLPLFGVPFIFTASRDIVDKSSCLSGDIYYYISYSVQALQGPMVALLFCYWNKEVQNLVKGSWKKIKVRYEARFDTKSSSRPTITAPRETRNTYVRTSGLAIKGNVPEKGFPIG